MHTYSPNIHNRSRNDWHDNEYLKSQQYTSRHNSGRESLPSKMRVRWKLLACSTVIQWPLSGTTNVLLWHLQKSTVPESLNSTVLNLWAHHLLDSKMSAALWKPSETHIYIYLSANWNTRPHTRIFLLVCILYSQRLTWEHQRLSHDFTMWLHTFLVCHCWFGVMEVM